jgi:hypothetical protein
MTPNTLTLAEHGAQLWRGAAVAALTEISDVIGDLPPDRAGIRLRGIAAPRTPPTPRGLIDAIADSVLALRASRAQPAMPILTT